MYIPHDRYHRSDCTVTTLSQSAATYHSELRQTLTRGQLKRVGAREQQNIDYAPFARKVPRCLQAICALNPAAAVQGTDVELQELMPIMRRSVTRTRQNGA